MNKAIRQFNISIRSLMILAALLICLGLASIAAFTKHTLSVSKERLAAHIIKQSEQVRSIQAIKLNLIQLELAAAGLRTHSLPAAAVRSRALVLQNEMSGEWVSLLAGLPPGSTENDPQISRLTTLLREITRPDRYSVHLDRAATRTLQHDIQAAHALFDELSDKARKTRAQSLLSTLDENLQHEDQLNQIVIPLAISLLAIIGIIYRSFFWPIRRLGEIAIAVGKGEATKDKLDDFKANLTELSELRDLISQMVEELTISNRFIASGASTILDLTHTSSNIAAQVRSGVIEETTISKDIFSDLREMRLGNQQMQDALDLSMQVLVSASSQDCLDADDIADLHHHLLLISDISQGWKSLGEDLGRVLDGFDDMVRDRMTLASELEKLTKQMSICAEEMAFRAT